MQKVLDALHAPILVGLLFYHDRTGLKDPGFRFQVPDHTRKDAVGMERRYTRNVPLMNPAIGRVNEAHRKVLNSTINR